jgi:hypothetical protein
MLPGNNGIERRIMALPKKPTRTADDFIREAKATKADAGILNKGNRGRPPGPKKGPLPVRLPLDLLEVIRANCNGNLAYFTEQVFREYFERNNIDIK